MGAALMRLALNTAAAAQGASATMRPRSLAPTAVFSPALTPEKRKPRTSAGPALTRIAILRARLLYGRARQINDWCYEILRAALRMTSRRCREVTYRDSVCISCPNRRGMGRCGRRDRARAWPAALAIAEPRCHGSSSRAAAAPPAVVAPAG